MGRRRVSIARCTPTSPGRARPAADAPRRPRAAYSAPAALQGPHRPRPATIRLDRLSMNVDDMQMHTIYLKHSETRAVAIAAAPDRVLALVGDARRLPDWAPSFARAVR